MRSLLVGVVAALAGLAADSPPATGIRVPPGFRVEVFASGLERPTAMAFGPGGRLYLTQNGGDVVSVGPRGGRPRRLTGGFETPLGLAWKGRDLYVASTGTLTRLRVRAGRVVARRAVLRRLPNGEHQQDNVVLGPDGRLYLGSGSTCNACRERDRRSATILSVRPDGNDLRIVATGLRNAYGLAFQPGTRKLYASVNGRDDLDRPGNPEPAELLVRVEPGDRFGWPDCWPSARELRLLGSCRGVRRPVAYLEPHSSADGFAFYTGRSFPAVYRGDVFLAEWGTYKPSRFGKRVDRVAGSKVSVFASGFRHPLAVAVDARGGLLVADWGAGAIYRIQARGEP